MPFLPPNQQRQSTEGIKAIITEHMHFYYLFVFTTFLVLGSMQ